MEDKANENILVRGLEDAEKDSRTPSQHTAQCLPGIDADVEALKEVVEDDVYASAPQDEVKELGVFRKLTRILLKWGVETHGITPVHPSKRTDPRIYQLFWVWFSCNFNILVFGTGSAGPAFFRLGLKSSLLVLLVVDIITCAVPAYFSVFGPKLGMRGMVQCRFSWGLYGAAIPSALNVISMEGFLILNGIVGGQAIAAVSDKLDDTLGIVILGVIALVITFCGYRVLHWFETYAWIPNFIAFPILIGLGKKHLDPSTFPAVDPPTPAMILSFGSFVASSVISWCTLTPDYGVYHNLQASERSIFLWTYFGFLIPSVPAYAPNLSIVCTTLTTYPYKQIAWHMLGAAFAAAAPGIPSWQSGFEQGNNVGGLIMAVLGPAGGFGKFMLVLIALSTSAACAPTMYTFGLSAMAIAPFFARIPRYVLVIISEAIFIPVAIVGAKRFYTTLVDILSVIGYWSTAFAAIVLTEHFVFRKNAWTEYKVSQWDQADLLPPGIAAVLAFLCAFGIVIPSMSQTWYTGPIARAGTGDIGVITGGVVAVGTYVVFRMVEKRIWPGR
ncbi:cytosine-purine permease [Flammula alnicola]|nr:cytosine-purine permease [Flammula alnicola]